MGYLSETRKILKKIDESEIEAVRAICDKAERIFFAGNGGGAAHASHAAADFRKFRRQQAICLNDSIASVTADANDYGWEYSLSGAFETYRPTRRDALFLFSVGGGLERPASDLLRPVSQNLIRTFFVAQRASAPIVAIVGKDGGYIRKAVKTTILIPSDSTPQVEGIQSVLAHMLACS